MNITRENLGDLDLQIKIELDENDYAERVTKQLKKYQKQAAVPGFRKGMAPLGLIKRMYEPSVKADEVQAIMSDSLFKYLDDEKLNTIGTPLADDEKTGTVDFASQKEFTFFFNVALRPDVKINWEKVSAPLYQVKITPKEAEKQVKNMAERYGKFETPEVISADDMVYGKAVELDKEGKEAEGGVSTFVSFDLKDVKDDENRNLFVGKKAEDKVVFTPAKAFTAADIEKHFRLEPAAAKKFKAAVEFTISGCSHITPHDLNEDLFNLAFPGKEIKDAAAFKKAVSKQMEESYNEQGEWKYVADVREQLIAAFDAPIPEAFLKRWFLRSGNDKDLTAEKLEADWNEKYLPSIKWELLESELEKIKKLEPTQDEIINEVKDILRRNNNGQPDDEETLDKSARAIAQDRQNISQLTDRLYSKNIFNLFNEQLKPEVEKLTVKEFGEKMK
ncbi:MAG: trigger factor [Bacteroidales bacterium]|nr:trigger factor [Bacteroidales bacterium]